MSTYYSVWHIYFNNKGEGEGLEEGSDGEHQGQ